MQNLVFSVQPDNLGLPARTDSARWFSYREVLFSGWGRFSSSFVNFFLVKICLWIDLFSVFDRKRTKLSPKLISLRIFGNFCVQIKQKGVWVPSITAQSWFFVVPPWLGGGGFCFLMCILAQNISLALLDKILFKTVLFLNSLQTNFRFWHLIVWLVKFKLKEGPENWYSGAFETDDFGWNLSKNAIFG